MLKDEAYELKVSMPTASGIFDGADVMMNGERVGEVTDVRVEQNTAVVTVDVDDDHAPLHAGTRARISWQSVLGFRALELVPGADSNRELPSGKLIVSTTERVEVDDLLSTLDEPTRQQVQELVGQLSRTLQGGEEDLQETIRTAGPAVEALGEVMRAVGEDGPAIRDLVTRLHAMTRELVARDSRVAQTVNNLGTLTSRTADEQGALREALIELPSTVQAATRTLDDVPNAVKAADPLLRDLRPATRQLPRVARDLRPVLKGLQPTVADLRPMLSSASSLLKLTPGLLDSAHQVLPQATEAVTALGPAVEFLRPYTPELVGWLSNWASLFGDQNSAGNYGRALIFEGATSFNDNPGILPPGIEQSQRPVPGAIVGQPWTDAYGDGMR